MNNPNILFLSIIFFLCLFSNTTFGQSYTSSISTEDYYQAALELHEQGNYSDAEAYYSLALAMDAHCEKCLFNRGLAYVALEKYRKALSDFTLLIEQAPTDIEAYEQRGYLRYQTGDTRGAISDFSAVISYAPSARAYTNRGMAYLEMKQYPDAIRDLEEALRLAPQDGEARRTLGDVYFASNEIEKALAEYNAAIQLNNRDIIAYNNRGNAYQLLGKDEEALADYSMGIALLPNSYTYTNRAKYWIKKENYNKAFTDALAATKLDYNNAEAFYCVGIIKNAQKNYALAYENFNKAIALDHNRGEYYNGRGIALFHLGEYEDASEDFESALHLNPADAAAKDRILDCHKKLN
ncbi:MAG TPA: tetratricopeptide repeat protein, partial [Phaeodactylibacter sp.]|nr:tetratricopeptide repeat protein [Phaeodactylibacter sp.]